LALAAGLVLAVVVFYALGLQEYFSWELVCANLAEWQAAAISRLRMLPGTFVYVLAGEALATVESPRDLLSTQVLVALGLLGFVPLLARKVFRPR
jgi:hypothetical protein